MEKRTNLVKSGARSGEGVRTKRGLEEGPMIPQHIAEQVDDRIPNLEQVLRPQKVSHRFEQIEQDPQYIPGLCLGVVMCNAGSRGSCSIAQNIGSSGGSGDGVIDKAVEYGPQSSCVFEEDDVEVFEFLIADVLVLVNVF